MKAYLFSFLVGCVAGVVYAAVHVRSPAPPVVALIDLLGMLAGENRYPLVTSFLTTKRHGGQLVQTHRTGIATARFVDHVGMTVPDVSTAIRFFEHTLGARLLWRAGPFDETPTGVAMVWRPSRLAYEEVTTDRLFQTETPGSLLPLGQWSPRIIRQYRSLRSSNEQPT